MKNKILKFIKAFSLIELLIGMIAVGVITTAMAPVITKKIKASQIVYRADELYSLPFCGKFNQKCFLCYTNECIVCDLVCSSGYVQEKKPCRCITCKQAVGVDNCADCSIETRTCNKCNSGYWKNGSTCTICPKGYKCDGLNKTACSKGTAQASTGKASCDNCNTGKYANSTAATSCSTCPAGTYSPASGAISACTNCSVGYYQNTAGQTACKACGAKTYADTVKASTCTACSTTCENSACSSTTGYCTSCPMSYYVNKKVCSACIAGCAYCSNNTTCNTCHWGYWRNSSLKCEACPAGYYCRDNGKTICPAGYYCPAGSNWYTACPAGQYAAAGASGCSACPAGTYTNANAKGSCTPCSAGYYNTGTGNTGCINCGAGYACSGGYNRVACKTSAGNYANGVNAGSCSNCGNGYFASDASGNWSGDYNGTKCNNCPPGWYCTGGFPRQCPAGQYQNEYNKTSCKNCPAGTYSSSVQSSSCANCPAGQYSAEGSSGCTNCLPGCATCTNGTYCTSCIANYYQDRNGGKTCIACPTGTTSAAGNFDQWCWGPPAANRHCPTLDRDDIDFVANFPEVSNAGVYLAKLGACVSNSNVGVNTSRVSGVTYLADGQTCPSTTSLCCWSDRTTHKSVCTRAAGFRLCEAKSHHGYLYQLPSKEEFQLMAEYFKVNKTNRLDKNINNINLCVDGGSNNGGFHAKCNRVKDGCPVTGSSGSDYVNYCMVHHLLSRTDGYSFRMITKDGATTPSDSTMWGRGAGMTVRCITNRVKRYHND